MKNISYAVTMFFITLLIVSSSYAKIPEIILKQQRAVVTVYVNDKNGEQIATGTGFIIDSNGVIATNYHVISGCLEDDNRVLVKMENGAYFPLSKIINYDEENDVAVFKVDGKELPVAKFAKNYKPKQGEDIVVIGSPLGLETTVSDGVISSVRWKSGIIQITAPISPGSSGSPVFNSKGEVIGIATFLMKEGQNLNFAIPVKHVANLLKETRNLKKKRVIKSQPAPEPSSTEGYGKRIVFNKGELYYTSSVSLSEASRLGQYLVKTKFFDGTPKAVQLNKNGSTYEFRMVIKKEFENDAEYVQVAKDFIKNLSSNVFGGSRVDIHFCDGYLQTTRIITSESSLPPISNGLMALDWNNKAKALFTKGEFTDLKKAIEYLDTAIKLEPNYAEAYNNRGFAYNSLGQYQRAIEDYNEAIRLKPESVETYSNRGLAYINLGQNNRGIEDCNKAILLKSDYAYGYNNRGLAYYNLGQYQRSIEDYNKAIDLNPDMFEAHNNIGLAYYNLGQYQRAIEYYNEAIRLKPDDATAHSNRGLAYLLQGRSNLGCPDVQKACALGICTTLEEVKDKGYCR